MSEEKKHLIVINTYNRINELNKTIKSINNNLPTAKICIISKGNEQKKETVPGLYLPGYDLFI